MSTASSVTANSRTSSKRGTGKQRSMHSVGDALKWGKGKLPDGHQPPVCLVRVSTPIASQGTPIHQMNMVYYRIQDRLKESLCHCSIRVKVLNAVYMYSEYPKTMAQGQAECCHQGLTLGQSE